MVSKKQSLLSKLVVDFSIFIVILLVFVAIMSPISDKIHNDLKKNYLNENIGALPEEIINGNYAEANLEGFLDENDFFYIANENSEVIYCDEARTKLILTEEEISLIPYEDRKPIVNIDENVELDGERHLYINLDYYKGRVNINSEYYILDENMNIVQTNVESSKKSFTDKEKNLICGKYSNYLYVSKVEFNNSSGQTYTAILFREGTLAREIGSSKMGNRTIRNLLLIVLFIFATIVYLINLYKNVRKPLILINEAIDMVTSGNRGEVIKCEGTKEFELVCNNFNKMSEELEKTEKQKINSEEANRKIIADISHDLKTPITVIQGYMSAFLDGKISEDKAEEYYLRIYKKAESMTDLVNALSEYSKINHSDFKLNMRYDNISYFAREYFIEKSKEMEIFKYNTDVNIPNTNMYCMYDEFHMKRVFDNIIANTVKHTVEGTCIYFELTEEEKNVIIRIGDDGPGIPDRIRDRIFQPFVTADEARSDEIGLGMAIVKMIIDYHLGTINIIKDEAHKFIYEIIIPKTL